MTKLERQNLEIAFPQLRLLRQRLQNAVFRTQFEAHPQATLIGLGFPPPTVQKVSVRGWDPKPKFTVTGPRGRGGSVLPEIDDEVLVAFLHGD